MQIYGNIALMLPILAKQPNLIIHLGDVSVDYYNDADSNPSFSETIAASD